MEQHQVCAQCTHNCALLHGKGKTASLPPSSFFKIMLGDDFSTVLHLPPKFSRTASDLVDKKIVLLDSSGHQWNAKISSVDGSLALEEGWNEFSLDHRLEVGDFVVFFYDNESHFYVQIYDRSGCERREFSKKRNRNKRSMDRSGFPDRDAMLVGQGPNASVVSEPDVQKTDSQKGEADVGITKNNVENTSQHDKRNGSAQSLCREENHEDPRHMTGQDDCDVNGTGKIRTGDSKVSHVNYGSCVHRNDTTECISLKLKETLDSGGATSKAPEVEEFSGKKNTPIDTDRSAYSKTSTLKLEENRKNNFVKSYGEVQECQFDKGLESDQVVKSKRKNNLDIDGLNTKQMCNGIPNISDDSHNGEMSKGIKQEFVSAGMTRNGASFKVKFSAEGEKMSKRIKKEPHVDMTPNVPSSNYEFGATGSSKIIKKELVLDPEMIDQDDNDDDHDHGHDIQTSASVSCMVPTDNDHFLSFTRVPFLDIYTLPRGIADTLALFLQGKIKNGEDVGVPKESNGSKEEFVAGPLP